MARREIELTTILEALREAWEELTDNRRFSENSRRYR